MEKYFSIKKISVFRSQIMGFAILWIILFHFYKILNPEYLIFPISIGYGGVDVFLFLSGFGIFYSWKKDNRIGSFYKKRFLRIFPAFAIVVLAKDILTKSLSLATLSKLSMFGLWLPIPHTYWYISAIMAFYFLFPFYMKFYSKYKEKSLWTMILVGVFMTSIYTFINHSDSYRNDVIFFLSRIPIFFIGVTFGRLSVDGLCLNKNKIIMMLVLAIVSLGILYVTQQLFSYTFLQNTALNNYPFIFLTPFLCVMLPVILSKTPIWINRTLSFLGTISLELYLIHLLFITLVGGGFVVDSWIDSILAFFVFLTLCIIASWILHMMIRKFMIVCKTVRD